MHHALGAREGPGNGATRDPRLLERVISNVALFRGVAQRQLSDLAARSKALQFRRGAIVCAQGQFLTSLYAVAYGQVKLALRAADGDERVLRIAGASETFGLAVAMLGQQSSYQAATLDDALLVLVPIASLVTLIENDPRFARAVIATLAERNVALLAELEAGALRRGVQRLASYLDSLAAPTGGNGGCVVRLPTTKTIVASRLGVKKETLSRMLRELAQKGLIAVEQREIAILDRLGLAAVAREQA